ncbi:MAG: putative polymerase ECF-subfamily sigma factor [Ilumatobacteraceae bacterium]|nr:putative polymerase ECF-subfamily sigma factor [Ilumatobacteraceae bacterium]MCU1390532.1 putative polymerase ECF-subfamily sigma factor [Ilumatobacteraceae bacterium]
MNATLTFDNVNLDMTNDASLTIPFAVSFDEFYRAEYPGLVAVATALVGSSESAEDLVQDTMVKSLIRWRAVQRLDRPGGWAHRVLLNACTSWWRRRRTEANHLARLRRVEPTTAGPSPDALAFWAVVRRLPERHRAVMVLHYAGDRSVAEVASILSVPEGTVRSDLTRARAALAIQLGA